MVNRYEDRMAIYKQGQLFNLLFFDTKIVHMAKAIVTFQDIFPVFQFYFFILSNDKGTVR